MAKDSKMFIDQLSFENQIIPYGESKEITFNNALGATWTMEMFFYRPFGLKLQLPLHLRFRKALLRLKCRNLERRVYVETKILMTSKYCSLINTEKQFQNHIEEGDTSSDLETDFENVYGNVIALNVSGELKIYVSTENYFYYKQRVCSFPVESKLQAIEFELMNELSSDLLTFLSKEENSHDIVLRCESQSVKAHKVLLSARSKVFSDMFRNPAEGSASDEVEIKDMNYLILRGMLEFIYSGKITHLFKSNAYELVTAAEQYAVPGLKKLCLYYIQSILSPTNALRTLTFAERYDGELKKKALDFICMEFDHLKDTEEWVSFQNVQPQLANEVLFNILNFVRFEKTQTTPTTNSDANE